MKTSHPQRNIKKLIQIFSVIFVLNLISFSSRSQNFYEIEEQEVDNEEIEDTEDENEQPQFIDGIEDKRFKSGFDNIENSKGIDYSIQRNSRNHHEINVFGNEGDFNQFQFKEDNILNQQSNQTNRIIISSESGSWQQAPSVNQTPNGNAPAVTNPFGTNPGVKSPRNVDAVPDNGDDPNDVPLDGGVGILALAAGAYGLRRFKK